MRTIFFKIDLNSNIEINATSNDETAVAKVFKDFFNGDIKAPSMKIYMDGTLNLLRKIDEVCDMYGVNNGVKSHGVRLMADRRYMLMVTRQ